MDPFRPPIEKNSSCMEEGNVESAAYRARISFSAMRPFLFSLKTRCQNRISEKKTEKRDQIRLKTAWSTVYIPTSKMSMALCVGIIIGRVLKRSELINYIHTVKSLRKIMTSEPSMSNLRSSLLEPSETPRD
jgi:hypothetical protein